VDNLAAMGDFKRARPIAEKAVAENPGDLAMVVLYWKILKNDKDYKKAIQVGEEMVRMDTALADSAYFNSMIGAAQADSNTAKVRELAAKAAAKFPTVTSYSALAASEAMKAGQLQMAVATARKALAEDQKAPNMRTILATAYLQMNQNDSALTVVREMIGVGEDKNTVAALAVTLANGMRTRHTPDSMKARGADAATIKATMMRVYQTAAWADTLAAGTSVEAQGKFIMGVAALVVGQLFLNDASDIGRKVAEDVRAIRPPNAERQNALVAAATPQVCSALEKANEYLNVARGAVPAGARFDPNTARQVMGSVMQLDGYVEQMGGSRGYKCK